MQSSLVFAFKNLLPFIRMFMVSHSFCLYLLLFCTCVVILRYVVTLLRLRLSSLLCHYSVILLMCKFNPANVFGSSQAFFSKTIEQQLSWLKVTHNAILKLTQSIGCCQEGEIWPMHLINPLRNTFQSAPSLLCCICFFLSPYNQWWDNVKRLAILFHIIYIGWTGRLTWLALEFAAVLLIDEAGGQSAEQHGRCQEADGCHNARHHGPRQTLVG